MNYQNTIWLGLCVLLLIAGVYVSGLARRRSNLLAVLKSQSMIETGSGKLPMQSVHHTDDRELEKQRDKLELEKAQKEVRLLTEERNNLKNNLAYYEKLYYPPQMPSLEEFRETQPEEYKKLKREVAWILRYATAKKRMREEYMARLDLSVLTEEERQMLIANMKKVAKAEDLLLEGRADESGLFYERGGAQFSDVREWEYEASVAHLAAMADWKNAGGTKHFAAAMRALFLHYMNPLSTTPKEPQTIRGSTTALIPDPQFPEGKRLIRVFVEPGWAPE